MAPGSTVTSATAMAVDTLDETQRRVSENLPGKDPTLNVEESATFTVPPES